MPWAPMVRSASIPMMQRPGDHREPAGDAAGRQRLLQDQPRQQHAA